MLLVWRKRPRSPRLRAYARQFRYRKGSVAVGAAFGMVAATTHQWPPMTVVPRGVQASKEITKPARDFQAHLAALEQRGLVVHVERPINKDTELHPLARWQFQGGLSEDKRRVFVFTNVVGSDARKFDMPVVVGALAASPEIYALGMGVTVEEIGSAWLKAIHSPIAPVTVTSASAPCQGVVIKGDALRAPGGGLAALPVPI